MTKDKRIIERFEKKEKYFNDNQLKNEIWKPLVGYEEIYKISNFGRIWSIVRRGGGGCFKKINFNKITGYYSVHLDNMDGGKKVYLHRLIALNFIPNLENKPCVDHINRNRQDNRIENLRWATRCENNINRSNNKNNTTGYRHISPVEYGYIIALERKKLRYSKFVKELDCAIIQRDLMLSMWS